MLLMVESTCFTRRDRMIVTDWQMSLLKGDASILCLGELTEIQIYTQNNAWIY